MAQADAEDRASCPASSRIVSIAYVSGSGSPGPLDRNTPSAFAPAHPPPLAVPGSTVTSQSQLAQVPGDVPLHAVVERHDAPTLAGSSPGRPRSLQFRPAAQTLVPVASVGGHDLAHQVATHKARAGLRLGHQAVVVQSRR